jgi:radical SAM superfamily enzyme YgiQ (UPF0313 family)
MEENRRILLLSANRVTEPYPVYPIGLSYLSTYLSKKLPAFEVLLVDMITTNPDELGALLQEIQPKYIGISLRNIDDIGSRENAGIIDGYKALMEFIRAHSAARVIIGGSGFSIFPTILFDLLQPDFGITGEGEDSFYQLIICLENNNSYRDIGGLVYAQHGLTLHREHREHREFIRDGALHYEDSLVPFYWQQGGMLNIQTKRGCPHHCIYCTYPIIEGKEVRTLNPDAIIESITLLKSRHDVDFMFFTDSVFNIGNEYNRMLAKKLIDSQLDIHWGAYFSPHGLDKETLLLYKEAGLTHIEFGTESFSDKQLKNYGKHFSVSEVLECSALCNDVGIHFAHFLILGGYGETDETLDETFGNCRLIENTVFFPYIGMRIYPGTSLAGIALEEGVITHDDDLLSPKYYLSQHIDPQSIKARAKLTGKRWIFPDDDMQRTVGAMREKQWRGPLWEHAKY